MKKIPQQRDIKYHPKVRRLERCEMDQLAHVLSLVSVHRASLCSVEERRDSRDVEMGHNRSRGSDRAIAAQRKEQKEWR